MSQNRAKIRAKRRKSKQEGAKRVPSDLHQKNLEAKKRRAEKKKYSARQAEEEPTPAPTARGYFLSQMWESLKLGEALESRLWPFPLTVCF